jgi:hypothetical protein
MRTFLLLISLLFILSSTMAQFSQAIEDNSYFIEEAFNQETNVVQHIFNGSYSTKAKDFAFTFTQEWPIGSQKHQLSYTVPYTSLHKGSKGVGDLMLNYRYQLFGENDAYWCSPRISLSIPTGNSSEGLGTGVFGCQVNIPISKQWSNDWISHFNLGSTSFFNVEGVDINGNPVNQTLTSMFVGTSAIFLVSENFNIMCETLFSYNADFDIDGNVAYTSQTILSPGFRYAFNLNTVQIVPGIAVPFTFSSGSTEIGIFGYLSFEHPF